MTSTGTSDGGTDLPPRPEARRPDARRRDRRGRGVRGPLAWPAVPAMSSRRQQFDDLVLDSAARLEGKVGPRLGEVDFAVEDVPSTDPAPWEHEGVPLGRAFPSQGRQQRARIVIYRRPIENRAQDQRELTAVVQDVVVEQIAALFGLNPGDLDPRYDAGD